VERGTGSESRKLHRKEEMTMRAVDAPDRARRIGVPHPTQRSRILRGLAQCVHVHHINDPNNLLGEHHRFRE
jgi:hypothetical protein